MASKSFIRGLLDDPEDPQLPQYNPQGGWDTAANFGRMAAGMTTPGAVADAAGLLGSPSLRENVSGGNYLDALLQGVGVIPGVGMLAKAGAGAKMAMALPAAKRITSISNGLDTAAVGRAKDERFWHPISGVKLSRPLGEMHAEHQIIGDIAQPKIAKPEDFEGSSFIPALGDRSAGGSYLTAVNEQRLENPTEMQAGHSFMYGPAAKGPDNAAWASDAPVITRLANRAKADASKGFDPYLSYTAMSNTSSDYSHHMADTLLDLMKNAKVKGDDVAEFDRQMRENTKNKWGAYKDWPGLLSEDLPAYLYGGGPGKSRTKMAELMSQGQFQKMGFPDAGAVRFAITEPGLLHAGDYSAGRSISRLDPTGRVINNPAVPHKTYKTQLGAHPEGGYVGGFEHDIPFDVMNQEWIADKMAQDPVKYANPSMLAYTYRLESPSVYMTPKVVDRLSTYLENKGRGLIP
jgi:hypothetical protein